MTVEIIHGDCREVMAAMEPESVHCVVTSPPYWGLRCYGVDGQLGQEPTLGEHIETLVEVFREVRRVLRPDGTLWLNMGDCYAGSANGRSAADTKAAGNDDRTFRDKPFGTAVGGLKPKDLVMMPARLALALQADGWWIRSDIIWGKPNPMPESVRDRPASAHEHVFLMSRSARYFYDAEAVRTPYSGSTLNRLAQPGFDGQQGGPKDLKDGNRSHRKTLKNLKQKIDKQRGHSRRHDGFNDKWDQMSRDEQVSMGANLRNVWHIATQPYAQAHFATFPEKLVEPCIKAGTSQKGCCADCGTPWERLVDVEHKDGGPKHTGAAKALRYGRDDHRDEYPYRTKIISTTGWNSACDCGAEVVPCVVLDPFGGSGTVGLVAERLGRNAILIELNAEYAAMARARIRADLGTVETDLPEAHDAGPLFEASA